MKQYITIQKIENYDIYRSLESLDYRFIALRNVFSDDFNIKYLIDWLAGEKKMAINNGWVSVTEEHGIIALYDISDGNHPEYISSGSYNPLKRFEMTIQNFIEVLFIWEKLRISRPHMFLIVIHEDNHVSLEADPVIIQQYQNAGYAFDITKQPKTLDNFLLLECFNRYFKPVGNIIHCPLFCLNNYFLNKYYPNREGFIGTQQYCYRDEVENKVYIGSFDWDEFKQKRVPDMDNIADYVNEYNSNIMSSENLVALDDEWLTMAQSGKPFGILYQNEHGWFHAQSFTTEQAMYDFVKNYRVEL